MRFRSCLLAALLLASPGFAQQEGPHDLPIVVPPNADVAFEADAAGKELAPLVRHFLSGNPNDPTAGMGDGNVVIKSNFGEITLSPKDVERLLEPIRELHVVSYSVPKGDEPFGRHEMEFKGGGMKRLLFVPGDSGFLLMQRRGESGRYAAVIRRKDNITVLRTDGMPDLGEAGRVILKELASAAQRSVLSKKH